MSALGARMDAIANGFAAAFPLRVVRRSFVDFNLLKKADLDKGVFTFTSTGEDDFTNVNGYMAKDGGQDIRLIGQVQIAENKNKDQAGQQIEEAEFLMVEDLKTFCGNVPEALCQLELVSWVQSQQIEEPYGWIAARLRYIP